MKKVNMTKLKISIISLFIGLGIIFCFYIAVFNNIENDNSEPIITSSYTSEATLCSIEDFKFTTDNLTLEERKQKFYNLISLDKYFIGTIVATDYDYSNIDVGNYNYLASIQNYYTDEIYHIPKKNILEYSPITYFPIYYSINQPVVVFYKGDLPENNGMLEEWVFIDTHDTHLEKSWYIDGYFDGIKSALEIIKSIQLSFEKFLNPEIILPEEAIEWVIYSKNLQGFELRIAKNEAIYYESDNYFIICRGINYNQAIYEPLETRSDFNLSYSIEIYTKEFERCFEYNVFMKDGTIRQIWPHE